MKVQLNSKVSVSYVLSIAGKEQERAEASNPLEFVFGHGQLLSYFEEQLAGLSEGDTFKFSVPPDKGYGEYSEENIVELSKDLFILNGTLQEDLLVLGNEIPLYTNDGSMFRGIIKAIKDDTVTVDLNHSLAGKTLEFEGKVENVREATEEELEMLNSCGCCCDSCDDHEGHHGDHGCCGC